MPSNVKKTPHNGRRKVTASARARISTRKVKKDGTSQNSSYLQEVGQAWKPSKSVVRMNSDPNPSPSQPTNLDILHVLERLEASNRALSDRLNCMEQNSTTSTPLQTKKFYANNIRPSILFSFSLFAEPFHKHLLFLCNYQVWVTFLTVRSQVLTSLIRNGVIWPWNPLTFNSLVRIGNLFTCPIPSSV